MGLMTNTHSRFDHAPVQTAEVIALTSDRDAWLKTAFDLQQRLTATELAAEGHRQMCERKDIRLAELEVQLGELQERFDGISVHGL